MRIWEPEKPGAGLPADAAGVSARGLTREQSAMLAAVVPNPKGWDPTKPSRTLRWRHQRILQWERNANFPEKLLR